MFWRMTKQLQHHLVWSMQNELNSWAGLIVRVPACDRTRNQGDSFHAPVVPNHHHHHHSSYYTRMRAIGHDECTSLLINLQSYSKDISANILNMFRNASTVVPKNNGQESRPNLQPRAKVLYYEEHVFQRLNTIYSIFSFSIWNLSPPSSLPIHYIYNYATSPSNVVHICRTPLFVLLTILLPSCPDLSRLISRAL